jgi:hypothetical protein
VALHRGHAAGGSTLTSPDAQHVRGPRQLFSARAGLSNLLRQPDRPRGGGATEAGGGTTRGAGGCAASAASHPPDRFRHVVGQRVGFHHGKRDGGPVQGVEVLVCGREESSAAIWATSMADQPSKWGCQRGHPCPCSVGGAPAQAGTRCCSVPCWPPCPASAAVTATPSGTALSTIARVTSTATASQQTPPTHHPPTTPHTHPPRGASPARKALLAP